MAAPASEMVSLDISEKQAQNGDAGNIEEDDLEDKKSKTLFEEDADAEEPAWKKAGLNLIDGPAGSSFMALVTIWALFGDDLRLIFTYDDVDEIFAGLTIACLIFFSIELGIASICKPDYFAGFYFWLDLVATVSLLLDIPAINEAIMGEEDEDSTADDSGDSGGGGGDGAQQAKVARAGRTSRAGTKAGRIVRLVRLIRIVKLYKSYMQRQEAIEAKEQEQTQDDEEEIAQSRVGQKLSDLTTRRVILGVLLMLFMLPLFDLSSFFEPISLVDGGLELVVKAFEGVDGSYEDPAFTSALDAYVDGTEGMYWIKINGTDLSAKYGLEGADFRSLRNSEFTKVAYQNGTDYSFAKFTIREESRFQAGLNILKTIFIVIILGMGAYFFSRDANDLVLLPIERMIKRVKDMAENPLKKQEVKTDDGGDQQMETKILENAFSKICSLMAVGFGEAGAEIIAENMKSGGELDPMVPGKKMAAIFGFCDIRNFTDATEILQEGVMEFVNSIAQIVHMEVSLHGGSANKNIGDAFLLVWKFPPHINAQEILHGVKNNSLKGDTMKEVNQVADKALATFVVTIAMLKKSARLRAYGKNEALCQRMPNYRVKMGFGLHVGWAIEGAIGSEYKVDASYLSPNVNMAARLEAATKQFGVPILISEDLVNILSKGVRQRTRQIDRVTVKGSNQPMGLSTYDVDDDLMVIDLENAEYEKPPENFTHSDHVYTDEFAEHPDIVNTRAGEPEFLAKFGEGFEAYSRGDWKAAHDILRATLTSRMINGKPVRDGPSDTLLRVMEEYDFKAPPDWRGFRELTEK